MIAGKDIGNVKFELGMGYYVHSLTPMNGWFKHEQKRFDTSREADEESEWAITIPKRYILTNTRSF